LEDKEKLLDRLFKAWRKIKSKGRRPRKDPDLFLSLKKFRMFMY